MTRKQSVDVAVVGGGIVGMSIAWEFVRRTSGNRVALIFPASEIGSASAAAGAMLSGFAETTRAAFSSEAGRAKIELRLEAAREWHAWIERLSEEARQKPIELRHGTTILTNSVSGHLDQKNFNATIELLSARGERFDRVDPVHDLGLRPSMEDRPTQAIFLPRECYVDSAEVLGALEAVLRSSAQLSWLCSRCREIRASGCSSEGYELALEEDTLHAKTVIVAAGVHSLQLLERVRFSTEIPPIFAGAGAALVGQPTSAKSSLSHAVRTPNRAFACGLHALPRANGDVYLGATNNVQFEPSTAAILSDVSFLIECAVHQIDRPLASHVVKQLCVGNRPISADAFPLLGETSSPGLWLATGTYRDGFLMAPLLAKRLFESAARGSSAVAGAELFVPERRPLASGDREAVIQEGIENYIAIAYERRTRLPAVGRWEDDFREDVERRVRKIYSELGSAYTAPPDFLWDIEHGDLMPHLRSYYERIES
jgi:glycine/D-amino acid oxidase-like deaminating enzyme